MEDITCIFCYSELTKKNTSTYRHLTTVFIGSVCEECVQKIKSIPFLYRTCICGCRNLLETGRHKGVLLRKDCREEMKEIELSKQKRCLFCTDGFNLLKNGVARFKQCLEYSKCLPKFIKTPRLNSNYSKYCYHHNDTLSLKNHSIIWNEKSKQSKKITEIKLECPYCNLLLEPSEFCKLEYNRGCPNCKTPLSKFRDKLVKHNG